MYSEENVWGAIILVMYVVFMFFAVRREMKTELKPLPKDNDDKFGAGSGMATVLLKQSPAPSSTKKNGSDKEKNMWTKPIDRRVEYHLPKSKKQETIVLEIKINIIYKGGKDE